MVISLLQNTFNQEWFFRYRTAGADLGTVTSVSGNTVVMTGSPAIVANDTVYRVDGSGEGAGTSEIQGMRAALSSSTGTSTYAGVARSTHGWTLLNWVQRLGL